VADPRRPVELAHDQLALQRPGVPDRARLDSRLAFGHRGQFAEGLGGRHPSLADPDLVGPDIGQLHGRDAGHDGEPDRDHLEAQPAAPSGVASPAGRWRTVGVGCGPGGAAALVDHLGELGEQAGLEAVELLAPVPPGVCAVVHGCVLLQPCWNGLEASRPASAGPPSVPAAVECRVRAARSTCRR
jgi:hypothetical protein